MIQSSFGFIAELRRKYRVPVYPCSPKHTTFSVVNILHFSGPFVKIDEPTLTHHYHPKSMVYIKVHPCIYSVGFDKYIMTYSCHYNIIQNSFTPLKILYFACSSLPPLQLQATTHVFSIHRFSFCRMSCNWNTIVCSLFRLAAFTFLICT